MTSYNYNIRLEQDLSTFFFFQQKQVLVFKMHHVINHHSHISINLSVNSMSKLYSIVVHQQLKFIIRRMFHQHFYIYPKKMFHQHLKTHNKLFFSFFTIQCKRALLIMLQSSYSLPYKKDLFWGVNV